MLRPFRVPSPLLPALAAALLALAAVPALSLPVLDQASTLPGSPAFLLTDNDTAIHQDIVVGATGQLVAVELHVADPVGTTDDLCCVLQVLDGAFASGGAQTVLGSASFPDLAVGDAIPTGWIRFQLSAPVPVVAGQAISLSFIHDNVMRLSTGTYAPGDLTVTCFPDGCHPDVPVPGTGLEPFDVLVLTGVDLAFRTYVVPEPRMAGLLGVCALAGLAGLGRSGRRLT